MVTALRERLRLGSICLDQVFQDVCKGSRLPVEGERCVVSFSLFGRFEVNKEEEGHQVFRLVTGFNYYFGGGWDFNCAIDSGSSLGGVPREQKILKGHLLRVMFRQAYQYTEITESSGSAQAFGARVYNSVWLLLERCSEQQNATVVPHRMHNLIICFNPEALCSPPDLVWK